jgi:hypothetical protein
MNKKNTLDLTQVRFYSRREIAGPWEVGTREEADGKGTLHHVWCYELQSSDSI